MEEILPNLEAGLCVACSDFPTHHLSAFLSSSFIGWSNDRVQSLVHRPYIAKFVRAIYRLEIVFTSSILRAVHLLGGRSTSSDPVQAKTNRARMMWNEAIRRGMRMEQILFFGTPIDCYRVRLSGTWVYFQGLPIPASLQASSCDWVDDKFLFKQFLREHKIPTAAAGMATRLEDANEQFTTFTLPIVVKPRLGSRARHTTPNIWTRAQFNTAFKSAQQLCRYVVFEEHLAGPLCRATVVDGKLVGFLKKYQPFVVGDGLSTVRELVTEKNVRRHERVWEIVLGIEHELYINKQGYTFDSVLEKGKKIEISRHSGRQVGGESYEMPREIHPKLQACVERLASLLSLPVVGFDLIIPDPTLDPDTQKWGILEANTVPFIELHYSPLYGEPSNIAAHVWDLWKKTAEASLP